MAREVSQGADGYLFLPMHLPHRTVERGVVSSPIHPPTQNRQDSAVIRWLGSALRPLGVP